MENVVNNINLCLYQIRSRKADKRVIKRLTQNFRKFKHMQSDDEFEKAYDSLWVNDYFRTKYLTANLFPRGLNDMAKQSELEFGGDIIYELRWQLKLFEKNEAYIESFISSKNKLDECIINGEYTEALRIIDEIETDFGISLWAIENRMMLQYKNGKASNKKLLEEARNGFFSAILHYFDMKANGEITAEEYEYLTNREISNYLRIYPEQKKQLDFYRYMVAPFSFEMDANSISNILSVAVKLPLIDRYLCVIDVLEHFLATGFDTRFRNCLCRYIEKLRETKDDTVNTFSFIISSPERRLELFKITEDNGELRDLYITGKLEECYTQTKEYIESNITDINTYNLFIEVCLMLEKPVDDIFISEEKKTILKSLSQIYTVADNYSQEVETIKKLCYGSLHSRWGRDIINSIPKFIRPIGHFTREVSLKYSNLQKLTVETVYENLPTNEATHFLKYGNICTSSKYLDYLISVLDNDIDGATSICGIDSVNGLLKIRNSNNYDEYEKLLSTQINEFERVRISKVLWSNMKDSTNIEKGIDYFLHLFFEREEYALIAPIEDFISYFNNGEGVDSANIRVPILYYILAAHFDQNTRDDLTIACEDFFDCNGIKRPSRMLEKSENYSRDELVYFLRFICIPQIMGPVLLDIRTTKGLDEERINICQYLRNLDPQNIEIYDEEIKDTTHKLYINDSVSTIESHKVQVNIEGIKSRINKDMKSVFNKYKYTRNSNLFAVLDTLKKVDGFENASFIKFNYSKVFEEIVTTIRNEFVKGEEYGLDTYLSLNIRHGMLTAQLRAPLTKINLYTEKDISSGQYCIHKRWIYCINDKKDEARINDAIIRFNEQTDGIIDQLKNQLIQVSTEEKPTQGVFDYTLSSANISYLELYVREETTFEDFTDMFFDVLWKKTDENLLEMKRIIREDIKQKYNIAFNDLIEEYNQLRKPHPDAKKWIREAQNDMDAMLEKVCDWFERSNDNQFADFYMNEAFHVGLKTVQNIHPEMVFKVRSEKTINNYKISGKFWKQYTTIFLTLLENVSEHAKEQDGVKYIDCSFVCDDSKKYIKMQNDFDCTKDYSADLKRIENANCITKDDTYLTCVNEEGGTGIPKIYKIFKVDLHMSVTINCYLNTDEEAFVIEITGNKNENFNN